MKDTYKTILAESTGEFKDKGSKFIAYTSPLPTISGCAISIEADFTVFLDKIRKLHPKARHHCFVF